MSRRGSLYLAGGRKDQQKKRVSLKDGTLTVGPSLRYTSFSDIKDGDVYYKTVHIYPSLPDVPDEITITVAKTAREPRSGSSADKYTGGPESRRGSVLSDRAMSPALTDSPSHGDRDRSEIKIRYYRCN